jgi:hypothetical protein
LYNRSAICHVSSDAIKGFKKYMDKLKLIINNDSILAHPVSYLMDAEASFSMCKAAGL